MNDTPSPLLSVVIPLYNEEDNVAELYRRLHAVLTRMGQAYELVLVDNGSIDHTLPMLKDLHRQDPCVRYLSLSRNYGHQGGLVAGLHHASGDIVISMDGDLQHPPELIPELVAKWRQGFDVVFTLKREDPSQSPIRHRINRLFYGLVSRLSGLDLTGGQSDFRLMNRRALDALNSLPEYGKFLRGLSHWIGFRQTGVVFDVDARFAGQSKFRFRELYRFALNGLFSFSVFPLRVFTIIGSIIAVLSLLQVIYALVRTFYFMIIGTPVVAGYPTLVTGIFLLGGIQLIGIGLLGEYLGRVLDEVKQRPLYIVRERSAGLTNRETGGDNA
ncbi:MAG: glycosyltransferase family 2 protein [Magnetococcales bacterium]|nr:glycosyltransferase family 2 protein [Magnetococcales bacterium]